MKLFGWKEIFSYIQNQINISQITIKRRHKENPLPVFKTKTTKQGKVYSTPDLINKKIDEWFPINN